ncbi:Hypothetical_protein [Hexamita inflata]|uniref:Hypothetical_protein n=1 Tax=Hexamita inflata TaxID=28002 RepID=A0AA86PJ92_9EUKA|nr:Hypothetical protein HINF_LOCUS23979 [Hexamita inflata]
MGLQISQIQHQNSQECDQSVEQHVQDNKSKIQQLSTSIKIINKLKLHNNSEVRQQNSALIQEIRQVNSRLDIYSQMQNSQLKHKISEENYQLIDKFISKLQINIKKQNAYLQAIKCFDKQLIYAITCKMIHRLETMTFAESFELLDQESAWFFED